MDKNDIRLIQARILESALKDVVFEGWRWPVIEESATRAGLDPACAKAVFPGGLSDVLDFFSETADQAMLTSLQSYQPETMRVRDRVALALEKRFDYLQQHKEAFRLSLPYWAFPTRKPRAARIVWRTADRIWCWAGDTSTDYNRYTKRALLGGILASSALVFINDADVDARLTRDFIGRRIENVMQMGKMIATLKKA